MTTCVRHAWLLVFATGALLKSLPAIAQPDVRSELRRKIELCEVPARRIKVIYAAELQDYAVTISMKGQTLSPEQYRCLVRASGETGAIISFDNEAGTQAFWAVQHEADVAAARVWLDQRGLLSRLPPYDRGTGDLATFARELEALCGIEKGAVLVAASPTLLTFGNLLSNPVGNDSFGCLLNAATASNLEEQGVFFGLVGNEAVSIPSK